MVPKATSQIVSNWVKKQIFSYTLTKYEREVAHASDYQYGQWDRMYRRSITSSDFRMLFFTRIGAADDLVFGQSTFMVEMMEATANSTKANALLILFDESDGGLRLMMGWFWRNYWVYSWPYQGHIPFCSPLSWVDRPVGGGSLTRLETSMATLEKKMAMTFLHKIEAGPVDAFTGFMWPRLLDCQRFTDKWQMRFLTDLENQEKREASSSCPERTPQSVWVDVAL